MRYRNRGSKVVVRVPNETARAGGHMVFGSRRMKDRKGVERREAIRQRQGDRKANDRPRKSPGRKKTVTLK